MPIFRKGPGPHELAVSLTGVKLGDRVLQIGGADGEFFAVVASKAGLTGRACVVDMSSDVIARCEKAAANAGVLIETSVAPPTELPYEDDSFDVVIVRSLMYRLQPEDLTEIVRESGRVLRPAGRCIVIDPTPRGGLAGLLVREPQQARYMSTGGAHPWLSSGGFKAVRVLADRDGLTFVEGTKPRTA
jgi:ubiquinone/menaquinone biosynthesis C-methylase UbiE